MRQVWGVVLSSVLVVPATQAQYTLFYQTPPRDNLADLLVLGPETARTLKVVFDEVNLPSNVVAQYLAAGGTFHIAAVLPNGLIYSYTRTGWKQVTVNTLVPAFTRKTVSIFDHAPPEWITFGADLSGLAGTSIYAGIGVGQQLTFSYVGSLLPSRPPVAPAFPLTSGEWTVSRTRDTFSDSVVCSVVTAPTTNDRLYRVRFGWEKPSKAEPILMTMGLYGASTGSFLFRAHPGNSQLRVDAWPSITMNSGTGAAYPLIPGTTKTEGPMQLYGNFEPNVSRMMSGQTLNIGFVSQAGTTSYTVSAGLQGYAAAVDAFDHCINTQ